MGKVVKSAFSDCPSMGKGVKSAIPDSPSMGKGVKSAISDCPSMGKGVKSAVPDCPSMGKGVKSAIPDSPSMGKGVKSAISDCPSMGKGVKSAISDCPSMGKGVKSAISDCPSMGKGVKSAIPDCPSMGKGVKSAIPDCPSMGKGVKSAISDCPSMGKGVKSAVSDCPSMGKGVKSAVPDCPSMGKGVKSAIPDSPSMGKGVKSAISDCPSMGKGVKSAISDCPSMGKGVKSAISDCPSMGKGVKSAIPDCPSMGKGVKSAISDCPSMGKGVKSTISDCPSMGKGVKSTISDCPSMGKGVKSAIPDCPALWGEDPEADKSKPDCSKVNGIKSGDQSPLLELSPRGKDQPNGEGFPGNQEETPLEPAPRRGVEEKEEKKVGWGQVYCWDRCTVGTGEIHFHFLQVGQVGQVRYTFTFHRCNVGTGVLLGQVSWGQVGWGQRGSIEKQSTGSKFPPKKPATPTKQSPRVYASKRMSPNIGQPYSAQAPAAAAGCAGQYHKHIGAPRYANPHYSGYQPPRVPAAGKSQTNKQTNNIGAPRYANPHYSGYQPPVSNKQTNNIGAPRYANPHYSGYQPPRIPAAGKSNKQTNNIGAPRYANPHYSGYQPPESLEIFRPYLQLLSAADFGRLGVDPFLQPQLHERRLRFLIIVLTSPKSLLKGVTQQIRRQIMIVKCKKMAKMVKGRTRETVATTIDGRPPDLTPARPLGSSLPFCFSLANMRIRDSMYSPMVYYYPGYSYSHKPHQQAENCDFPVDQGRVGLTGPVRVTCGVLEGGKVAGKILRYWKIRISSGSLLMLRKCEECWEKKSAVRKHHESEKRTFPAVKKRKKQIAASDRLLLGLRRQDECCKIEKSKPHGFLVRLFETAAGVLLGLPYSSEECSKKWAGQLGGLSGQQLFSKPGLDMALEKCKETPGHLRLSTPLKVHCEDQVVKVKSLEHVYSGGISAAQIPRPMFLHGPCLPPAPAKVAVAAIPVESSSARPICTSVALPPTLLIRTSSTYAHRYGFVDFESPGAAQKAVQALQAQGVLAQMAKVQTTWIQPHPHYVMQPHMGSASMMTTDSGMHMHPGVVPGLANQMNQLSLSGQSYIPGTAGVHNPYVHHYPQPSGVMQTVPVEMMMLMMMMMIVDVDDDVDDDNHVPDDDVDDDDHVPDDDDDDVPDDDDDDDDDDAPLRS
uniref:RRM domain-containing protein n=1 Tax=Branchiostoma floridae TaxID=7739 RepID=C3ZR65_BRAFL|eukprot:XP_002588927.1 hypothetical protein BRAFLDRAFT_89116 [Branchiostoma floridae]